MYKVLFVDYEKERSENNACTSENVFAEKNGTFVVAVLDVSENILQTRKDEIDEILAGIVKDDYDVHYLCATMDCEIAVVLSSENKELFERGRLYPRLEEIRQNFEQILSKDVCMGVSTAGISMHERKIKYLECKRALEHKLYMNNASTIFFEDIQSPYGVWAKTDIIDNPVYKKMENCILEGKEREFNEALADFEKLLESIADTENLKNAATRVICKIFDLYKTVNKNIDNIKARKSTEYLLAKCSERGEIIDVVSEISRSAADKFYNYNNTLFGVTLKKILAYVSQNYEKLLTRDDIAKAVGVTPNYVSVLFRKGFDMTFVEYITNLRINEAKKLLENTDKKIYQIAEAVGFEDAYYFSKNFKKVMGMSPKEYRIKMQSR